MARTRFRPSSRRWLKRALSASWVANRSSSGVSRSLRRCASALQPGHLGCRPGRRRATRSCALVGQHPHLLDERSPSVQVTIASAISGRPVEPAEQPDHARDVVLVAAALAQAAGAPPPDPGGPLHGFAEIAIADRHGQLAQEAPVVLLAVVLGVVDQVELRVLLPLRVEALAGDVGADRRHQVDADHRDQQLQADDAGEDGQHRPGPPAGALALPAHAGWRCRRKKAGQASDFPGKDMARGYGKNPRGDKRLRAAARRASRSAPMPEPRSSGTLVRKLPILVFGPFG